MILQTPFKRHAYAKAASVQTPFKRHAYAQFHIPDFKRPTYAKPFRVQTPFKRPVHTPPVPPGRVNAPLGRSRLTLWKGSFLFSVAELLNMNLAVDEMSAVQAPCAPDPSGDYNRKRRLRSARFTFQCREREHYPRTPVQSRMIRSGTRRPQAPLSPARHVPFRLDQN